MTRQPSLFVGHGAPTIALDPQKGAPLKTWGAKLGTPSAVLVVSAHWEHAPPTIGTTERRPLIYDFSGFPRPLYQVQYPAPGAPALADRLHKLLGDGVARNDTRGLDHGVWTPLVHMFPNADVPVLQLSLPSAAGPKAVFALGEALAPLRDEGVLLLGSGNVTHNLYEMGPDGSEPEAWARDFDTWTRDVLARRDWDTLLDFRTKAPAFRRNHPSSDHWLPLLVTAGAGKDDTAVSFPVEGFEYKNLSRRAVQLG